MDPIKVLRSFYGFDEVTAQELLCEMRDPQSVHDLAGYLTHSSVRGRRKVSEDGQPRTGQRFPHVHAVSAAAQ